MSLKTGTNSISLLAQRRLAENSTLLERSYQRLSSGLRINSAVDDAAGLAVASRLTSDAKVFAQGSRNLSDGLSLLGVAEGALSALSSIVQRQIELAQQSANGVYSSSQRDALDTEAQALRSEYNRIVATTEFNDINLFGEGPRSLSLQAGIGSAAVLGMRLGDELSRAVGNATFGGAQFFATPVYPAELAVNDFNQDGHLDVAAVLHLTGNRMHIFLGNGDGSFRAPQSYVAASGPMGIDTADVNNDGIADILYADRNQTSVSVYVGNGDGSFKARVSYLSGTSPNADPDVIRAGDMNADGNVDLVVNNRIDGTLSILMGIGDGTFQAQIQYTNSPYLSDLELVDVNQDGFLDVTGANAIAPSGVAVWLNNGNGTLKARINYTGSNASTDIESGDINNDGIVDLMTEDAVYLGNGDGSFKTALQIEAGTLAGGGLVLTDFDEDGNLDFVFGISASNTVRVFHGNGDGTFASYSSFSSSASVDIQMGDFNEDGVPDLIVANNTTTGISGHLQNTDQTANEEEFSLSPDGRE